MERERERDRVKNTENGVKEGIQKVERGGWCQGRDERRKNKCMYKEGNVIKGENKRCECIKCSKNEAIGVT